MKIATYLIDLTEAKKGSIVLLLSKAGGFVDLFTLDSRAKSEKRKIQVQKTSDLVTDKSYECKILTSDELCRLTKKMAAKAASMAYVED